MAELLLTHGYFLYEDPKELQIMKPYAPLGILYLCSHLRNKGFDVDVFDTTFSNREALFHHLRTETPSAVGIYANLMTRGNVVEILKVAREAGWKTIVGGPEPGAYAKASSPCKTCSKPSAPAQSSPALTFPALLTSTQQAACTRRHNDYRSRISTANPGPPVTQSTSAVT
jgi:hypothetical protein